LLKNGVDFDLKDKDEWTPLLYAAENGYFTIVVLLLENGIEANSKTTSGRFYEAGQTLLLLVIQNRHEAIVKLLLESNIDINSKDGNGRTPLSYTASAEQEVIVKLLLNTSSVKAKLRDNSGRTPLS